MNTRCTARPVSNTYSHSNARADDRADCSVRRVAFLLAASGFVVLGGARNATACPPLDTTKPDNSVVVIDPANPGTPEVDTRSTVRIAMLLDTSNSMDGLIGQAKTQLWGIVNKLAQSSRNGRIPRLQIALYEYGNNTLSAEANYVRMVQPFTDSLDTVSEQLFGLRTNGGSEYCGAVIEKAARDLSWTWCPGDLNMMVIAGNEPFTQGGVDYRLAIPEAVRKHIVINTIFCGERGEGVHTNWQDGAVMGKGTYAAIEQDKVVVHIRSPYDDAISKCNEELNTTYMPYGALGENEKAKQTAQDRQVRMATPAASMARTASKASGLYSNTQWDVVDAVKENKLDLKSAKDEELPEELRGKTVEKRVEIVRETTTRRVTVQKKIQELEVQRQQFLADEAKKAAGAGGAAEQTLGDALMGAIQEQAQAAGFTFESK